MTTINRFAPHVLRWADTPPFTPILVSKLAAPGSPVYIPADSPHAKYHEPGLHVATEEQRAELLRLEKGEQA